MIADNPVRTTTASAYGWLLVTMVLWGSAFPSSRWAVGQVPHELAAFLRFGGSAVILLAISFLRRPGPRVPLGDLVRACFAGLVGVFGYNALFFWGVTMAPASDGSVILPALTPVITTAVLILTRRESARPLRVAGLVVGVAGAIVFFVVTNSQVSQGSSRLIGDMIFLGGAVVWSIYTLLSRTLVRGMDPVRAVTFGTVAGAVALGVLAVPTVDDVAWGSLSTGFWANAAYLAIGPTAIAYLLFVRGIRDAGASTAAAMMFTVPVFGTAFSILFLGEAFTAAQAVAAVIMVGGAYLAVATRE